MNYKLSVYDIDVMFFGLTERTLAERSNMSYKDHMKANKKQVAYSDYGGDTSRFINEVMHTNHRF